MRSVLHVEAANAVLVLLEVRVLIFRAWSAAEGVAAEGVVAEAVVVEAVVEGEADDDGQVEAYTMFHTVSLESVNVIGECFEWNSVRR